MDDLAALMKALVGWSEMPDCLFDLDVPSIVGGDGCIKLANYVV